jgi:hypothetical protein
MRKYLALLLVLSLLVMNCSTYRNGLGLDLAPGQKAGAEIIVETKEGRLHQGELIVVKRDSLLIKESHSGADLTVDLSEIKLIVVLQKANWAVRLFTPMALGTSVGLLVETTAMWGFGGYVILGFLIGTAVGGLWVFAGANDKFIAFEGMTESEIWEEAEKLRKIARIRDFS